MHGCMYIHTCMYVCIYICSYVSVHAQFCYSYIIIIVQNDYTMLTDVTPNRLGTLILYLQLLTICLVLSLFGVPIWAWLATHVATYLSNYMHNYIVAFVYIYIYIHAHLYTIIHIQLYIAVI